MRSFRSAPIGLTRPTQILIPSLPLSAFTRAHSASSQAEWVYGGVFRQDGINEEEQTIISRYDPSLIQIQVLGSFQFFFFSQNLKYATFFPSVMKDQPNMRLLCKTELDYGRNWSPVCVAVIQMFLNETFWTWISKKLCILEERFVSDWRCMKGVFVILK